MSATVQYNKTRLAAGKLKKAASDLKRICQNVTDTTPSEVLLERKIETLESTLKEYDKINDSWVDVAELDEAALEEAISQRDGLQDIYEEAALAGHDLLHRKRNPQRNHDELVADIRGRISTCVETTKAALDRVGVLLNNYENEESDQEPTAAELATKVKVVTDCEDKAESDLKTLFVELIILDPQSRNQYETERTEKIKSHQAQVHDLKARLAYLETDGPAAEPLEQGRSGVASSEVSRKQQTYFQRRPFPVFGGEKREYMSFRKEWKETVGKEFPEEFQLREIRKCVPKEIVPDIKNLPTMTKVWDTLNEEYGQVMDICNEAVHTLTTFKFPSQSKTESLQFRDLYRKWQEVVADLEEVGRLSVLDHEPTIWSVAKRLPSAQSRVKFVEYRSARKGILSELEIMTGFMQEERQRQKALENIEQDRPGPQSSSQSTSISKKCFKCGEDGHMAFQCKKKSSQSDRSSSGKSVNVVDMSVPHKPCPACHKQHEFKNKEGKTLYKSRLSSCSTWSGLSVGDRAALIQSANGCSLCTDWTSDHRRDSCDAKNRKGEPLGGCRVKVDGKFCGLKHHNLLHGSTLKFCNLAQAKQYRRSPVPSKEELEREDQTSGPNTLMQMQYLEVEGDVNLCSAFWDSGSNINLVRKGFVKMLGSQGLPCVQYVQVANRDMEPWQTAAHRIIIVDRSGERHEVLAYEVDQITRDIPRIDVSHAIELFPEVNMKLEDVTRPCGPIDLLIGIQQASLHPTGGTGGNVVGNLRLLDSKFGTGKILDGSHPSIQMIPPVVASTETINLTHAVLGELRYQGLGRQAAVKSISHIKKIRGLLPFTECEELGVTQPKRCGNCSSCVECSIGGVEMSRRDREELAAIKRNLSIDEKNNKLTFSYPLLKDPNLLGDNRQQVISMALGLEKRLKSRDELSAYNEEMKSYLSRGVIRPISDEELQSWDGPCNYVSHHGVVKPGSSSTKLRIVSNSSLDNNNKRLSYNDILPKGPNSLTPLLQVLVTWRTYENVAVWDLAKAYNTVHTGPQEMHMRRLVWRFGQEDSNWQVFGFLVMAFGDRPAGCGLEVAKEITRKASEQDFPLTAKKLEQGSYVDDSCAGGSIEEVDELIGNVTKTDSGFDYDGTVAQVYKKGGFNIKVMVRNGETDVEVLDKLGGQVLGLPWDANRDVIPFHLGVNISPKRQKYHVGPELTPATLNILNDTVMTRRLALSAIYSIYDPLGLVTPLTIKYKILLRELIKVPNLGWDDQIPSPLDNKLRAVLRSIVEADDVVFHRSVKPPNTEGPPELIAFWDGGDPAYGGVIYVRHKLTESTDDGRTHSVRLLASKARVTPIRRSSTPRSEMGGLVLVSRLISSILPGMVELPSQISTFGDSECTINAVESDDNILKPWFDNRVSEIVEHRSSWSDKGIVVDPLHHWPGVDNIADIVTKGEGLIEDIQPGGAWQEGPSVLSADRSRWPASRDFKKGKDTIPVDERRPEIFTVSAMISSCDWLTALGCSSVQKLFCLVQEVSNKYNKLSTVIGVLARFLLASTSQDRVVSSVQPTPQYLKMAENLLYLVSSVETSQMVQSGKLVGLAPVWSKGRWVTRGRLGQGAAKILGVSHLPILLNTSRLAYLVMYAAHLEDHKWAKITLWRSRSVAWIHKGYKLAQQVDRGCGFCRIRKAVQLDQRMGPLPEERLNVGSPPWTGVAIDLLGPTEVKSMTTSRSKMKVWPLVITCLSTGALKILLMHSYGTQAFLLQWEFFTSQHGCPSVVYSDKGSQLTSASNYVKWPADQDPSKWGWDEISGVTARQGTEWRYVPAGCQYRNGLAESRVKATKSSLHHMFAGATINGHPTISYAELQVLLSRVACVINDRPLGVRSLTNDELIPVTPNQLLMGRTSTTPVSYTEEQVEGFDRRLAYQEELLSVWWCIWSRQVFPNLIPYNRYKDAQRHQNLVPGDICLLKYDGKVKPDYRLCKVMNVKIDDEGLVRTVEIGLRPRDKRESNLPYKSKDLQRMEVGVKRLVLIQPADSEVDDNMADDDQIDGKKAANEVKK